MRKFINLLFVSVALLITSITFPFHTQAESGNMNFSISVDPPSNQFNKDVTYFDLMVKPSEKTDLKINVSNTGKKEEKIRVTPTNATTNSNGLVDYSKKKKDYEYDKTLKIPFTSLVSDKQSVSVKPGETKTLTFKLEAPKEAFDGLILGGFVTDLEEDEKEKKEKETISFVNKFQLVKGVVLRSSEKKIEPELKLNEVKPALVNYRTAITANLQNTTPVLLGKVKVEANVTKKDSTDVIRSEKRDDVEFAPNSNFDFPIMWDNEPLESGRYTIDFKITADKKDFHFTEDFNISREDSYKINDKAVDLKEEPSKFNIWIIVSVFFVLVILILIFVLIREKKKKNTKKKSKSNSKYKNNKKHKK